jgi:hypothetical protein
MKSKALVVKPIFEMTENRAKRCQVYGHSSFRHPGIGPQNRQARGGLFLTSRTYLLLVFFLGLPAVLGAQKQQVSWSNLNGLKSGQGIEVIESSMKHHAGEFVTVTDEVLTLKEHGTEVSLKRENVARVSTASGAKRGEHAVIGLVVGGLIGAGIGAASSSSTGFLGGSSRGIGALVGVVIGASSGAIVGAVIPAHTTVYRAAPAAASH